MYKLQNIVNFDCDFTLLSTALNVGKLDTININLNKQFVSLRKVITEHWHRIPRENLKAEKTNTWIISKLATSFEYWFVEGDMLLPFGSEDELLSLPWCLAQQLSYSSDKSSRLEVESRWLFGELLLSQILANNFTNGSVKLF